MVVGGKNVTSSGCRSVMVPKPVLACPKPQAEQADKEWHEQMRFDASPECTPTVPGKCQASHKITYQVQKYTRCFSNIRRVACDTLPFYVYSPLALGVTLAAVEEGSPAAGAGLAAGSIIYSINNIPVKNQYRRIRSRLLFTAIGILFAPLAGA